MSGNKPDSYLTDGLRSALEQKEWVRERPPLEALRDVAERIADRGEAGEAATILVALDRLRADRIEMKDTIERLRRGSDPVLRRAALLRKASVAFDLGSADRDEVLHVAETLESLARGARASAEHTE